MSLEIFDFKDQPVRLMMREDQPWWVAADVCRVLEISNPRDAISHLDEDEKGVATTDTLGGSQKMNLISESGLYTLIFKSRKPQAKSFRKWVTSEVLPALRRTGAYVAPGTMPASISDPIVARAIALRDAGFNGDTLVDLCRIKTAVTTTRSADEHPETDPLLPRWTEYVFQNTRNLPGTGCFVRLADLSASFMDEAPPESVKISTQRLRKLSEMAGFTIIYDRKSQPCLLDRKLGK